MGKKRCRGDEEKIDTATTFDSSSSSSSSKFGSFIFLASYHKFSTTTTVPVVEPSKTSFIPSNRSSEHALIMLSPSESGSSDVQSGSEEEKEESDGHCWWSTEGGSTNDQDDNNNNNNDIITCSSGGGGGAKYQVVVFKGDNNNNLVGYSNGDDDDDQQQQQQLVFKLDSLGFPPLYKFCYSVSRRALDAKEEIVGSCNGLVCLYDRDNNEVSLWNPRTEEFRILPESITIPSEMEEEVFPHRQSLVAFGFDVETNDYKVVLLRGFRSKSYRKVSGRLVTMSMVPMECFCQVQVYSLSTDSWRLLKGKDDDGGRGITSLPGYPFFQYYPTEVLYLNGSCFFMAHFFHSKQQRCIPENNRFIISFDLTKEIITPIQLPDHHRDQELYLFSYLGGDKIALFTATAYVKDHATRINYQDSIRSSPLICSDVFDIWVLNEHGSGSSSSSSVKMESWVKLRSFKIERESLCQWNLPRGISNDGDFVLLENMNSAPPGVVGKKMKLYSLVTKEVEGNFLSCSRVMSKAYPHKPSQVSIIGGNGAAAAAAADMVNGNGATKQ